MKKIKLDENKLDGLLKDFGNENEGFEEPSGDVDHTSATKEDSELNALFQEKMAKLENNEESVLKTAVSSDQSSNTASQKKTKWISASLLAAVFVGGLVTFLSTQKGQDSVNPADPSSFQTKSGEAGKAEPACDFTMSIETIPSGPVGLISGNCNVSGFLQVQVALLGPQAITQHFNVAIESSDTSSLLRTDTGKPAAFALVGEASPILMKWAVTETKISKTYEDLQKSIDENTKAPGTILAGKTVLHTGGNP